MLWIAGATLGAIVASHVLQLPHDAPIPAQAIKSVHDEVVAYRVVPTQTVLLGRILRRNATVFLVMLGGLVTFGATSVLATLVTSWSLGWLAIGARIAGTPLWAIVLVTIPHGVLEMIAFVIAASIGLEGWSILSLGATETVSGLRQSRHAVMGWLVVGTMCLVGAAWLESTITRGLVLTLTRQVLRP